MKKVLTIILLLPTWIIAQENQESLVFENVMLTVHPTKIAQFEAGVAAHNKKYHSEGAHQANVYNITTGKNAGKYMWNMGPLPWSAIDNRPTKEGHEEDWNTNVAAHTTGEADVIYWKFHPQFSNFSKDFTLKHISVFMLDVKRFKDPQAIEIIKKVQKVQMAKRPNEMYGVYTNEMANMDGQDIAWVSFFDKMSFLGQDDTFVKDYEVVHGEGTFLKFLADVDACMAGEYEEIWTFRKDLSGTSGQVVAQN